MIVGFFHPFCHAGGGGERVLWAAIRATQNNYPNAVCAVYTGDHEVDRFAMLKRVQDRFSIPLDTTRIVFIYVSHRRLVSPQLYPHFTLLLQSFGSIPLAYSALSLLVPDIFIDTMGYPFTYPFIKLLFGHKRVPVGAYVHYPTISTDMLDSLPSENASIKMKVKKQYWKMFSLMYRTCGSSVDVVMTNSSWTARHIRSLWPKETTSEAAPGGAKVVFPPCSVSEITSAIPITNTPRQPYLLSIAQFRPEKRIDILIRAFAYFYKSLPASSPLKAKSRLVLLGSVRDDDDAKRVYELRLLAHELGVKEQVEFVLNAPWKAVLGWLGKSWVGVNAMWNEHFGIGVVEYLAAGLVGVVHDSGGPKEDIVVEGLGIKELTLKTGYHATDIPSFASAFQKALSLPSKDVLALRKRAQASSARFSEEVFAKGWLEAMEDLVDLMPPRKKFF
ncbi:UDP-Glycosyltransferase/glycogen phosphorylase [Terfezia boudieri ATCC MYA-4762]|uniref:GDP-Man:Man(3)GlcNAc(2)-PP-Dol alpha-1,2-mannosyltransferase n=1 Tax=Terfezia boudieri ATCC MYA-4762 TaxID=1051890 RepID=A0A3N4M0P7_9PEZI|nr:UDP-Glycosyltransferase/glycogen phosphorylase [Terfezia boudieri ATCC MYA-4762]